MALMPKRVKFRKFHKGRARASDARQQRGLRRIRFAVAGGFADHVAADRGGPRGGDAPSGAWRSRVRTDLSAQVGVGEAAGDADGQGQGRAGDVGGGCASGTVMYEIGGVPEEMARGALVRAAHKMPVKCRMVRRRHGLV